VSASKDFHKYLQSRLGVLYGTSDCPTVSGPDSGFGKGWGQTVAESQRGAGAVPLIGEAQSLL